MYESHPSEKSSRIFNAYLQDLGLSIDFMQDKRILDVGALKGAFASEAKKYGIAVTSLDRTDRGQLTTEGFVLGSAQRLPFADESFDLVVARAAFHDLNVETKRFVHEARRVLKPGGELRIGREGLKLEIRKEDVDVFEALAYNLSDLTAAEKIRYEKLKSFVFSKNLYILRESLKIVLSWRPVLGENIPGNFEDWPPRVPTHSLKPDENQDMDEAEELLRIALMRAKREFRDRTQDTGHGWFLDYKKLDRIYKEDTVARLRQYDPHFTVVDIPSEELLKPAYYKMVKSRLSQK